MIGGQSINHLFLGIIGTLFFVSCQSDFYSVKPAKVAEPDPESEPAPEPEPELCTVGASLESALPLYVDSGDLYVPNAELQQIDNSSSDLKDHAATYNTCGGTNYFKLDKLATSTLIQSTVGKTAKDFLVITPSYSNMLGQPQIELMDGDDTVVFEGYQDFKNTVSSVDMGDGDDHVVLGASLFDEINHPGGLILGAGADKIYLAPIENPSVIEIDLSEDKIVLTGGLTFADLIFNDYGSYYSIRIKESKSLAIENIQVVLVNIKATTALNNINLLNNPANFIEADIVSAKKGLYKTAGTKFPVAPVSYNTPTYLLEITNTGSVSVSNLFFSDYMGTSFSYEYIDGANITYDYLAGVAGGGSSQISGVIPAYISTPNKPWSSDLIDNPRTINLSSWSAGGYNEISPNMTMAGTSLQLGYSGGATYVSHPFDLSDLTIYNDHNLILNGKAGGKITHWYGNAKVVLSRMASGALLETTPGVASFHFFLSDGLTFSDLIITDEGTFISINVLDDANKQITLLKLAKANGLTLGDVNNMANFTSGGSL